MLDVLNKVYYNTYMAFAGRKFFDVLQMSLSKHINSEGKMRMTQAMEMSAPRDIKIHRDEMMSTLEYKPTPKVAAKKPRAETMTDGIAKARALVMAVFLSAPPKRSDLYRDVMRMA